MKKLAICLLLANCLTIGANENKQIDAQENPGCGCCPDCNENAYQETGNCDCCSECEYTTK